MANPGFGLLNWHAPRRQLVARLWSQSNCRVARIGYVLAPPFWGPCHARRFPTFHCCWPWLDACLCVVVICIRRMGWTFAL